MHCRSPFVKNRYIYFPILNNSYPKSLKMKSSKITLAFLLLVGLSFTSCSKEKEEEEEETTTTTNTSTTSTDSSNTGNNGNNTGGGTNTGGNTSKPAATTFKFAATGKDCGLTDGYANQIHPLVHSVHLNTDKCNGETYRPTITLNFEGWKTINPGTYTVTTSTTPTSSEVHITSSQYNYTNWTGTNGTVEVTQNQSDTTKIDIEMKSITMSNDNASTDTVNPATDVLTGYIIEI